MPNMTRKMLYFRTIVLLLAVIVCHLLQESAFPAASCIQLLERQCLCFSNLLLWPKLQSRTPSPLSLASFTVYVLSPEAQGSRLSVWTRRLTSTFKTAAYPTPEKHLWSRQWRGDNTVKRGQDSEEGTRPWRGDKTVKRGQDSEEGTIQWRGDNTMERRQPLQ